MIADYSGKRINGPMNRSSVASMIEFAMHELQLLAALNAALERQLMRRHANC